MHGTSLFVKPWTVVKPSSLFHEMNLRIGLDKYKKEYCRLKSMGMLRWPAYKEEQGHLHRLLQIIYRSIHVYRQRRLEAGFFTFVRRPDFPGGFNVHSPLYRMPLKEALKKRRQMMKNRKRVLLSSRSSEGSTSHHKINSYKIIRRLLMCTVASVFLGCIIYFYVALLC